MISKKAPAFLGTPPGEGGGGGGKGGRTEGDHPAWQGAQRPKVGDTGRPGARRRTLAPAGGSSPLIGTPRRGGLIYKECILSDVVILRHNSQDVLAQRKRCLLRKSKGDCKFYFESYIKFEN